MIPANEMPFFFIQFHDTKRRKVPQQFVISNKCLPQRLRGFVLKSTTKHLLSLVNVSYKMQVCLPYFTGPGNRNDTMHFLLPNVL